MPFDHQQAEAGREKTFYRTKEGQDLEISRIDDILTQRSFAAKPGATVHTITTSEVNTDHKVLCAQVPYNSIGQLPLPVVEEHAHGSKTVLVTPMSAEDKQSLKLAMDNAFTYDLQSLYHDLTAELENNVKPYWENLDQNGITMQTPQWAHRDGMQETINEFGNRVTDILSKGHQIALQVCTTQAKGNHQVQHYQLRSTARVRNKYLRLQKRLRQIRYGGEQLCDTKEDGILVQMLQEQVSKRSEQNSASKEAEDQLKDEEGKALEGKIKASLRDIDQKDASFLYRNTGNGNRSLLTKTRNWETR